MVASAISTRRSVVRPAMKSMSGAVTAPTTRPGPCPAEKADSGDRGSGATTTTGDRHADANGCDTVVEEAFGLDVQARAAAQPSSPRSRTHGHRMRGGDQDIKEASLVARPRQTIHLGPVKTSLEAGHRGASNRWRTVCFARCTGAEPSPSEKVMTADAQSAGKAHREGSIVQKNAVRRGAREWRSVDR